MERIPDPLIKQLLPMDTDFSASLLPSSSPISFQELYKHRLLKFCSDT